MNNRMLSISVVMQMLMDSLKMLSIKMKFGEQSKVRVPF